MKMEKEDILMEEISWQDLKNAVSNNFTIIFILGSIEQHGPHLPLGTDVFIPLGIAKKLAKRTKSIIAPPIYYGYYSMPRSGGGRMFLGTTSVSSSTLINLIREIIGEFIRHGFKKILVLNGHYENTSLLAEGVEKAIEDSSRKDVKALIINWWDLVPKHVIASVFPEGFPGWEVEHAAVTETSLIQALRPELVQTEKIKDDAPSRSPPYEIIPPPSDIVSNSGVLWKATLASQSKGKILLEAIVERVVKIMEEEYQ